MAKEENLFEGNTENKQAVNADKLKALRAAMDKIEKNFGKGSIMKLGEEQIENIRPGYTDTVLDKSQAEALISGSIRISSGIDNYPETALLFNGGRLKAYKKLMDSFAGNADRYLKEFEESGTEFTLHNIFLKLQEKSRPAVMKTAMILEILVIAIAVIFYSGIILTATGMKKGWFKARNRSLTFGEDVR